MNGPTDRCPCCDGRRFGHRTILWESLVVGWGLSAAEKDAINEQQGTYCLRCGANLQSMALALAISGALRMHPRRFARVAARRPWLRVLEVNPAGDLHVFLRRLPRHQLVTYPQVDFMDLPFVAESYDLVVHSETLEHVIDPAKALSEALRVLKPGGFTCYTVPFVAGRLTRSTEGRPVTYHGSEDSADDKGLIVRTEYGSDFWESPLAAGFTEVRLFPARHSIAVGIAARKAARPLLPSFANRFAKPS